MIPSTTGHWTASVVLTGVIVSRNLLIKLCNIFPRLKSLARLFRGTSGSVAGNQHVLYC